MDRKAGCFVRRVCSARASGGDLPAEMLLRLDENLAKCKLDLPSRKATPPPLPLSPFPICQLNQNPGISRQVFSLSPILQ